MGNIGERENKNMDRLSYIVDITFCQKWSINIAYHTSNAVYKQG
jgi:hypothetical protein